MTSSCHHNLLSWLPLLVCLHCLFPFSSSSSLPTNFNSDAKQLHVGQEIVAESMALRSGRRLYNVLGLKDSTWYEVKISYPASIPASFSIELVRDAPAWWLGKNRRLLNTEKLIFKANGRVGRTHNAFIQVTVEAAGIVAMRNVAEREMVIYNIVCDELMLGIPHNAWWVGIAAIFCLFLGVVLPCFLPVHLLEAKRLESKDTNANKNS